MDASRQRPAQFLWARAKRKLLRTYVFTRKVVGRTLRDGWVHAGNIAYLSLVTLFPLAILLASVTSLFGQTEAGQAAIAAVLRALPPNVADVFAPIIDEVVAARSGAVLWIGGVVALWTVTTFIETLRDVIHRAFEVKPFRSYWGYRLRSMGATLIAMILVIVAFVSQIVLLVVVKSITHLFPYEVAIPGWIDVSRALTPVFVFLLLWAIFKMLSPHGYHRSAAWPGALITTLAWIGGVVILGPVLSTFGDMSVTYGALSGVMVALLFFYAVGFALVLGAELNAALARPDVQGASGHQAS